VSVGKKPDTLKQKRVFRIPVNAAAWTGDRAAHDIKDEIVIAFLNVEFPKTYNETHKKRTKKR